MNASFDDPPSLATTDELLDRIEAMAQSSADTSVVWQQILASVKLLARCLSVSLVVPLGEAWKVVQSVGAGESARAVQQFISEAKGGDFSSRELQVYGGDCLIGSIPVGAVGSPSAYILVTYPASTSSEIWQHATPIIEAFAEIGYVVVTKQQVSRAQERLSLLSSSIVAMSQSKWEVQLNRTFVDAMQVLLQADRVSLFSLKSRSKPALVASSNSMTIDRTSRTVQELEREIANAMGKPDSERVAIGDSSPVDSPSSDSNSSTLLQSRHALECPGSRGKHWVMLEWSNSKLMGDQLAILSHWFLVLGTCFSQQSRWLSSPSFLRRYVSAEPSGRSLQARVVKVALVTLVIGSLVFVLLRPYPMTVAADAKLEPKIQRAIYAPSDGLLEQILVRDGEYVQTGQALAVMRSPELEIMAEEAVGKLRAMAEKRKGLVVAMSQNKTNDNQDSSQNRITSELLVLDAEEKHTIALMDFIKKQQDELVLRSPIDGTVVASEMRRQLDERPLKRGDSLFQIVRLDHEWVLQIQLADRDSQWVRKFYKSETEEFGAVPSDSSSNSIQVQFDSLPGREFQANVTHINNSTDSYFGEGSYQRVTASVDTEIAKQLHMGSTARATFHCGTQPFWFVWSRPFIEFIQTRTGWFTRS